MKYKLLKDLPLAKTGEEVITREINETSKFLMIERHSEQITHLAMISKEIIKEWLEPIVEKKTYDDLKEIDKIWYINRYGHPCDNYFDSQCCRSETFLTREEAEDENKRREWAVRPDRYIPELGTYYYSYTDSKNSKIDALKNFGDSIDCLTINNGLAFRSEKECQEAIDKHDLVRLFYKIR